jgi:hypothetical protein
MAFKPPRTAEDQMTDKRGALSSYRLYLWHLRVPLISGAALVGLPYFALGTGASGLLSGLLDPLTEESLILLTVIALFNAWTISLTGRLILAYGAKRLSLPASPWEFFPVPRWVWPASALLAVPLVISVIVYAARESQRSAPWMTVFTAAGVVIAWLLLWLALIAGEWMFQRGQQWRKRHPRSWMGRVSLACLRLASRHPSLSDGFIEINPETGNPELARGHGLALVLGTASIGIYVLTGVFTSDIHRPRLASALTFVLLLTLSLTWLAAFAGFLLDRTRVPLTVYLVLWMLIVNLVIDRIFPTDHIYRTAPLPSDAAPRPMPASVLDDTTPAIFIAASGGGIQAAAWTTRVLTGLQQSVPEFAARLRVISAVSGGSAGTMNFLAALPDCGPLEPARDPAFTPDQASQESSLHAIGWGLVFKDLPRTIAPVVSNPYVDRGSVLEDAWKREERLKASSPSTAALLSSWRRNVADRRCPGVLYNALGAETGEPLVFSTMELPPSLRNFDFYRRYESRDVPVTTAARLSAGFPYVSPASRADSDDEIGRYLHVVDGGYYDNYGVNTLVAWLHAALNEIPLPQPRQRFLIIEICDTERCSSAESTMSGGGPKRAWPYQLLAPLSALMATRGTGQRVNNRAALDLLKRYWERRHVCMESRAVPFSGAPGPLSWHLTESQKKAINDTWKSIESEVSALVTRFLAGEGVSETHNLACEAADGNGGQ